MLKTNLPGLENVQFEAKYGEGNLNYRRSDEEAECEVVQETNWQGAYESNSEESKDPGRKARADPRRPNQTVRRNNDRVGREITHRLKKLQKRRLNRQRNPEESASGTRAKTTKIIELHRQCSPSSHASVVSSE
jgi:hypothetical protein